MDMGKSYKGYSGAEHVPACSAWPPAWLAEEAQPAPQPPPSPPPPEPRQPPTDAAPDGWDASRAAVVLSDCERFLDDALADASLTPPQRSVAEVLRGVVRTHAERGDALLWSDREFLAEQFAGWRRFNTASAPKRKTA